MYMVCVLRLSLYFGMRLTAEKNFFLRLTVEKIRFSPRNIYGHTAVVAPNLPLLLTVEI